MNCLLILELGQLNWLDDRSCNIKALEDSASFCIWRRLTITSRVWSWTQIRTWAIFMSNSAKRVSSWSNLLHSPIKRTKFSSTLINAWTLFSHRNLAEFQCHLLHEIVSDFFSLLLREVSNAGIKVNKSIWSFSKMILNDIILGNWNRCASLWFGWNYSRNYGIVRKWTWRKNLSRFWCLQSFIYFHSF